MSRIHVEVDDEALAAAAEVLGTESAEDTIKPPCGP